MGTACDFHNPATLFMFLNFLLFFTLELLFAHCACGNFLSPDADQDRMPIQRLYTSRDHQKINDLEPPEKDSYFWYYSPVLTDGSAGNANANANSRQDEVPMESRNQRPKKALVIQRIPYLKTVDPVRVSVFLEPPTLESVSDYANYQVHRNHPVNLEEKHKLSLVPQNHRPDVIVKNKKKKKIHDQGSNYVRDHAPVEQPDSEPEQILENKQIKKSTSNKKSSGSLELSTDGDRIEFQIQGHEGPKTYIFGFDTGDGKNRQFRLEERLKDGTVKGHYGYYDARGKLRAIKYLARPVEGYNEKHHESNNSAYKENETH